MGSNSILTLASPATIAAELRQRATLKCVIADYWALTKPEINLLIAVATCTGYCLAFQGPLFSSYQMLRLSHTLFGTLLVASGAGALNQYVERRFDAQMRRTARRPLAAGRLRPSAALRFGIALASIGIIYLLTAVNVAASLLSIAALLSYLFLYTPLKRKTALCTLVGAFPGAIPPLIGWAAASGGLHWEAGILYAVLFLWQFPHFMAITWIYRKDYGHAGYRVLPNGQARVRWLAWQTMLPLLALFPISMLPTQLSRPGMFGSLGALLLSLGLLYYGARFVLFRSNATARRLLLASIIYLPALFLLKLLVRS
jgi:protoheme IX farnesyltransferase